MDVTRVFVSSFSFPHQHRLFMLQAVALAVHGASETSQFTLLMMPKKLEKNNLTYDVKVHYNDKTEEINRSIGNLSSEKETSSN